jgi:hypothetical protein
MWQVAANGLSHQPLDPIARDGIADAPAHGKGEPTVLFLSWEGADDEPAIAA